MTNKTTAKLIYTQISVRQNLPLPLAISGVIGKLDRIYKVHFEPQDLERKHRTFIPNVARHHMTLDG